MPRMRSSTSRTSGPSGSITTSRSTTSIATSTSRVGRAPTDFTRRSWNCTTETGLRINFATIGCAIAWAPFYAVADLFVRLGNSAGLRDSGRRLLHARTLWRCASGPPSTASWRSCCRGAPPGRFGLAAGSGPGGWTAALAALVMVWVGTPLFFYMYLAPAYSHAVSAFAVAAFVTTWLSVRRRWSVRRCSRPGRPGGLHGDGARAGPVLRDRPRCRLCLERVVVWTIADGRRPHARTCSSPRGSPRRRGNVQPGVHASARSATSC